MINSGNSQLKYVNKHGEKLRNRGNDQKNRFPNTDLMSSYRFSANNIDKPGSVRASQNSFPVNTFGHR